MGKQHDVFLIGGDNDEKATVTEQVDGAACKLTCTYRQKTIEAKAADFFEALCEIRRQLERERLIPFCYGASLNVYPSGMARDMGQGLTAYRLTKGVAARMPDLVGIFESGPDVIPASVSLQEEFWREWTASLRR